MKFSSGKNMKINQGAQDSGIPEIPGIVMGFFFCQGIPEKPGNVMGFFHNTINFF